MIYLGVQVFLAAKFVSCSCSSSKQLGAVRFQSIINNFLQKSNFSFLRFRVSYTETVFFLNQGFRVSNTESVLLLNIGFRV